MILKDSKAFNKDGITYETLYQSAKHYQGETNFCTVIAMAIALGCKFGKARSIVAKFGRSTGNGLSFHDFKNMLAYCFKTTELYLEPTKLFNVHNKLPSKGTYLVLTKGHVSCVKDGKLEDWSALDNTRGRGKKVLYVWRVDSIN